MHLLQYCFRFKGKYVQTEQRLSRYVTLTFLSEIQQTKYSKPNTADQIHKAAAAPLSDFWDASETRSRRARCELAAPRAFLAWIWGNSTCDPEFRKEGWLGTTQSAGVLTGDCVLPAFYQCLPMFYHQFTPIASRGNRWVTAVCGHPLFVNGSCREARLSTTG